VGCLARCDGVVVRVRRVVRVRDSIVEVGCSSCVVALCRFLCSRAWSLK
jgi:hypothetical protein